MSGLFNTILQIGGAVGVAVFGTVYLDLAPTSGAAAVSAFSTITFALAAVALAAAECTQLAISSARTPVPSGS